MLTSTSSIHASYNSNSLHRKRRKRKRENNMHKRGQITQMPHMAFGHHDAQNTSIQVYNKRRSKDRYRWKQKREEIFTSSECVMLCKENREREREKDLYRMKNIKPSLPNYILMLRARRENGTKMATSRKRERERRVKYIGIYNRNGTRLVGVRMTEWMRDTDWHLRLNGSNRLWTHLLFQVSNPAFNYVKHIATTLMFTIQKNT